MIYNHPADRSCAAGDIFGTGDNLDIHPMFATIKEIGSQQGIIEDKRHLMSGGYFGDLFTVRNIQLRIGNTLDKYRTGLRIDRRIELLGFQKTVT